MSSEKPVVSPVKAREAASVIQWHPGFCSAVEFELRENKDILTFDREFEVSRGPLFLDLLVIKKLKNVRTANEIGRIFRMYNVCEFKSPSDSLTIDDYFKTIAYASLVKNSGSTVNAIPANEITLTFIRRSYPREMMRELTESGAVISKQYSGVYYLSRGKDGNGDVLFPTQVIVTGELDKTNHSSLRVLTRNADEDDVRLFLEEALSETEKAERENVDAILQVSVSANMELFERIRRNDKMCQALKELMKDEFDKTERRGMQAGMQAGRAEGMQAGMQAGRAEGMQAGRAEGIRVLVSTYRDEMGLDDQTIIGKISTKFNLSGEQAKAYVLPQGM